MKIQQKIIVFFSLFFVILVAGCSAPQDPMQTMPQEDSGVNTPVEDTTTSSPPQNEIPGTELPTDVGITPDGDLSEVLANVNGEEIIREDVVEIQELLMMQGQQFSEQEALNQVIAQTLIQQDFESMNIELSEEEALSIIEEELAFQGLTLEEYQQQIEASGVSFSEELENIIESLAFDQYVQQLIQNSNFEITHEDIQQYYELVAAQFGEGLPPLEEMEDEIISMIESEFEQEILNQRVQELEQEANIQIN